MMRKTKSMSSKIRVYQQTHPDATASQVAEALGTNKKYVTLVRYHDRRKAKQRALDAMRKPLFDKPPTGRPLSDIPPLFPGFKDSQEDVVNHPSHYKVGGIETIDFIEAKQLDYHLGNVIKYITRANHKGDRMENLRKAQWYLNRAIEKANG